MIGMTLLGLHFFLLDYDYDPDNLEWLIILSLLLITLMCLGLTPVPSTILSEIFSSDLKSVAGFIGSISSAAFAFVASKTYQPLVDLISEKYVFWIYALIIMISLAYSLTMLPETKGKTLQVIWLHIITRKEVLFRILCCILIIANVNRKFKIWWLREMPLKGHNKRHELKVKILKRKLFNSLRA